MGVRAEGVHQVILATLLELDSLDDKKSFRFTGIL
jgi:hypothetical protein